jgi:hypothetical protein
MEEMNLEAMTIWRKEALERIAEDQEQIKSLLIRIEELEFHLSKMRQSAYTMYSATVGVIQDEWRFDPEAVAAKTRTRKSKGNGK